VVRLPLRDVLWSGSEGRMSRNVILIWISAIFSVFAFITSVIAVTKVIEMQNNINTLENVVVNSSIDTLHSELDTLHNEVNANSHTLRNEIGTVNNEMNALRNEVKIDIGTLNSAIQQNSNVLQQTVRSGGGLGGGGAGGKINPPLRGHPPSRSSRK